MSILQVRLAQGVILALAVALRLAAAAIVGTSRVPWPMEFEEIADNLVSSGQYTYSFYQLTSPQPSSFLPPVYPLLVAWARSSWQANGDLVVKILQGGGSCLTILCLYALARQVGLSERQGLLVGLLWAVYPPAVAYVSDLSTVTLEALFAVSGVWLVMRAAQQQSARLAAAGGCLLSLAALTRPTWLVTLPLAAAWMAWYFGRKRLRAWWPVFLALFVAATVALAPWVAYNYRTHGAFLLTSTNGGLNFWIGNNPKATGEYVFPPAMDAELVLSVASWPEITRDRFFYEKGWEFIQASPGQFLQLAIRKLQYHLLFRPNIGSNYASANIAGLNLAATLFILSWLALLPFALVGLLRPGPRWRPSVWLLLVFLANAAVSVAYFTGSRFRTPVDGFAMIWAVMGIGVLVTRYRQAVRGQNSGELGSIVHDNADSYAA
jgi:4-amino-4-deoxy-L-arabinose transferase-like glycosyltransferase